MRLYNYMLSVIIVSYNTRALLQTCLSALLLDTDPDETEIIVVDNASLDASSDMVAQEFPQVHLIRNSTNVGFAAANNQGLRLARGSYLLLLNSDTQLLTGAVGQLMKTMQQNTSIGAVGGKLLNADRSLQPSAGYFPFLWQVAAWMLFVDDIFRNASWMHSYHLENSAWYEQQQQVDWITGACLMVSRACYEKVGGLDEHIFMYGEEVEWCYRMRLAGYVVVYQPAAMLIHSKGASAANQPGAGIAEEFSSLLYFYRKHLPPWQLPVLKMLLYTGAWLRLLIFGIIGRYRERRALYAKAIAMVGR